MINTVNLKLLQIFPKFFINSWNPMQSASEKKDRSIIVFILVMLNRYHVVQGSPNAECTRKISQNFCTTIFTKHNIPRAVLHHSEGVLSFLGTYAHT